MWNDSSLRRCPWWLIPCIGLIAFWGGRPASAQDEQAPAALQPQALESLDTIAGAPAPEQIVEPPAETPEVAALLEQARIGIEDGRFQQVLDLMEQAAQKPGGARAEVYYLTALAQSRLGRFEPALQAAEQAAALRYGDADIHYLLGQLYRGQGRADAARAQYRTVTLAAERDLNNPKITRAWFALGQLLEEGGYDLAAAQAYEHFDRTLWETHAEQRNAAEFSVLLAGRPNGMVPRRIELLRKVKRFDDELRAARWARTVWPDDPNAARFQIQALMDKGDGRDAFALAREWLEKHAAADAILPLAIEAAAQAGELEAWLEDLTERVAAGDEPEAARRLARALEQTGDQERLVRIGARLLEKWPGDDALAWAIAAGQQQTGDLRGALRTLANWVRHSEKLVELSPERLSRWKRWFAGVSDVAGLVREARAGMEPGFATDFVLAVTALAAEDTVLAEQLLQGCLAEKPDFAPAFVVQGEMFLTNYQYEAAKQYTEKILKEHPNQTAALFLLARACAGLDENDRAEDLFKQALKQAPDEPLYNLALAQHYRRLGNLRGAQRYFQQVLTGNADNGDALEGVIDCYLRAGKLEIAKAALDKLDRAKIPPDALRRIETLMRHLDDPFGPAHLAELEAQFDQYPEDVATARMLAGGLYYRCDLERTESVILKTLARFPDDYHLNVLLANVHMLRGDYPAAVERFEGLLRCFPNRVAVMQPLAQAYLNDFRLEEGRALLRRLIAEDASETEAYRVQLLDSYVKVDECDEAVKAVEGWLAETPENEDLQSQRLAVLLECDRNDEAFELLKKRLEANPDDQHRNEFIQYGAETGHTEEMAAQLREWLKDNPANAALTQILIAVLLQGERADEALEVARKFEGTFAESLLRRIWMGQCQAAKGDTDAALAEYRALLAERGVTGAARREVRFRIITAYLDAGRYDEGLEQCTQWLRDNEQEPGLEAEILQYKRFIFQETGRDGESAGVLETMLQAAPDDTGLMNDLGYTWVDMGINLERGTRMIKKASAAQPWNAPFLDSLGWAYYKAGDFSNARKYLERSVRLRDGRDPTVYDHLADAAYRLGDQAAARAAWEKAVRMIEDLKKESEQRRRAKVLAEIRTKLAALQRSEKPKTAPTAAEQGKE
jgi:tetratricopeptide (TPR) repeat protein